MSRRGRLSCLALALLMNSAAPGAARAAETPQYTVESFETDAVGDPEHPGRPAKALQDTVWIADWTFDVGGSCTADGWVKRDNRVVNDGQVYWSVDNRFNGLGGVVAGKAAILGKHDLCWARDGYGNDWDQSIVLKYAGAGATLTFHKASDSEAGFDFVTVEADSLGLSEARMNLCVNPLVEAAAFRSVLARVSGVDPGSMVGPLALPNFGPGTHEVYIRFESGSTSSDEDGGYPTAYGAGLVVDNVTVTGALAYSENFEGALHAAVQFANTANAAGFCTAPWLRLKHYITDNDKCTENTSCAWLDTDPLRTAYFPDMAFGPDAAVVHNWLDDLLVSPWIHLPPAAAGTSTVLSFRRFPGNAFSTGSIVQGWRVRTRRNIDNTDTPGPGDVLPCVSAWGHDSSFNTLGTFAWMTSVFDMTPHFSALGEDLQISFRTTDWRYIGQNNIVTLNPGPGPYLDRVRIGRCAVAGPILSTGADTRSQAQDCFPTLRNTITPGEHFSPDGGNRFGTCAFSAGLDLGATGSASNLITADSIFLESVVDARGTGGIASVKFLAAITAGVHAGKAPAPYAVGANGFFEIHADSARTPGGVVIANRWFVDLDDTYFRGGDVVKYVWLASDQGGGAGSSPAGLLAAPVSVAEAELQTGGLREVSFLPAIDWAPSYVARVQADEHGDLDPTPPEITASTQRNCILYFQKSSANKNSGAANRTAFQYSLDRCGYAGHYDEYDCQGYGNTNNQLGGRATVAQCSGYALIIQDDGRSSLVPNLPDGSSPGQRINQSQWYRNYLSQGATGLALTASLWLLGENTAFLSPVPLLMTDMGLANVVDDQAVRVNPDVVGLGVFRFANGVEQDFTPGRVTLNGGCPTLRAFDGAAAAGTAVVTHQYRAGATAGLGAVVMNASAALHRNTIWMGFGWMDLRDPSGAAPGTPELTLMQRILAGVLPVNCIRNPDPTDVGGEPGADAVPQVTALHANVPNPFNPATKIAFDLAQAGAVRLQIFDVAGHAVKTLVDGATTAGRHEVTWTGLDDAGRRVSSGVYFYQLVTDGFSQTRRMALLK